MPARCDTFFQGDAIHHVMAMLDRQIVRLVSESPSMRAADLAGAVDHIRHTAHEHGLTGLADIAHALTTTMARHDGGVAISPWLDAMRGLLGHDPVNTIAAQSWITALSQRYHA